MTRILEQSSAQDLRLHTDSMNTLRFQTDFRGMLIQYQYIAEKA